jgi:histidyl-tRNA synthetase
LLYGEESPAAVSARKDGRQDKSVFLDIIGSGKSIAEALLIKTAWTVLEQEGVSDLTLALNTMGDRESLLKFIRELAVYYRKNIHLLPPQCRQAMRRDPLLALSCAHEKCAPLKPDAPKAMEFLSEASRTHFKEVLEYLEALAIPYRLDHCLVGSKSFMGETVFELRSGDGVRAGSSKEPVGEPTRLDRPVCPPARSARAGVERIGRRVCFGFRYNGAAKKIGFRKDMPAIGATLFLSRSAKREKGEHGIRMKKPRIFFLQLGFDAKLQCLKVIETLRLAGIPLYQAIARDKLATQLATAENLKMPYSLIMGQKEALEESVIVRNNGTRAQETVKIRELPPYLKKLKLA